MKAYYQLAAANLGSMNDGDLHPAISTVIGEGHWTKEDAAAVRSHFDLLSKRYLAMGYTSKAIRSHIDLLKKAAVLREGIPSIRLDVRNGDPEVLAEDDTATDDSFSSAGAVSDASSYEDSLSSSSLTEVTFACNVHICRANVSSVFHRAGLRVFGVHTFGVRGSKAVLGHFFIRASVTQIAMKQIEDMLASAAKRPPPSSAAHSPRSSRSSGRMLPEKLSQFMERLTPQASPLRSTFSATRAISFSSIRATSAGCMSDDISNTRGQNNSSNSTVNSTVNSNSTSSSSSSRHLSTRLQQPSPSNLSTTRSIPPSSATRSVAPPKPSSASDGKDLLQVFLCETGAMKKKLGSIILNPLHLSMGPVIAVGATGEVRRGTFEGEAVAVKVLKAEGKDARANVAEFRREVLTLMACGECPQLLKFLGICVDIRQRMCIVTKFMEGGTLCDALRRSQQQQQQHHSQQQQQQHSQQQQQQVSQQQPPLPMSQVLQIARDVALAMSFLHRNGMIHRDLKSANILLDRVGNAVVGDFGVARLKTERGEMTKEVGTYRWMAPEAFGTSAWPVTHRSDVYSYGIVLWEMVTGGIPFADYSPLQAAVAVALNGARPLIPGNCPGSLKSLIERCWHKVPKERPEFSEVLLELERISKEKLHAGSD